MYTVNIVVMDLVGSKRSHFMGDLNEYSMKCDQDEGYQNHLKRNPDSLPAHWWTHAHIKNINNDSAIQQVDLRFYRLSVSGEDKKLAEENFNAYINIVNGYIFVITDEESTWSTTRRIIQSYQAKLSSPFIIFVEDRDIHDIDVPRLRKGIGVDDNIEVFAYRNGLKSELENVVLGICYCILDDLEAKMNQDTNEEP